MSALYRIAFGKVSTSGIFSPRFQDLRLIQRGIKGSVLRSIQPLPPKAAPYPYTERRYNFFHFLFRDCRTSSRFDENSKLIIVEGPVACGKTKFAKELAKDLDMYYMPEANLDMWHTNEYGYNFKDSDDDLPQDLRCFDIKNFLLNPNHRHAARFQLMQYIVKFSQYVDALAHIFSTGQGVVLERCVYSDFVFLEAMFSQGYVGKEARSVYYEVSQNNLFQLLRPHVLIYLDVSVEKTLENIKRRNITSEIQSSVLTPSYLQVMEDKYKQIYLKENTHAELLVYDWNEEGEMEVIIEDLERLDFTRADEHDLKSFDWVFQNEDDWAVARYKYTDTKDRLMNGFNIPRFDVPEFVAEGQDCRKHYEVYDAAPGNQYEYGYNSKMGDPNVFLKLGMRHRFTLPLVARNFESS